MPYRVKGHVVVGHSFLAERYDKTFDEGVYDPKNEIEEHALEHLVALGLADRVKSAKEK